MSGIIIAAVVVSCTGLLLGLFLGVMGKKFYVEVDQKEIDVRAELLETTVVVVDMQDVMHLLRQLPQEKLQLTHVQLVAHRLQQRLVQSWVRKLENQ